MNLTRSIEFDAGHRVARHTSKCAHPHGHRYRVEATVEGPMVTDPDRADFDMVVDFSVLSELLTKHVHDVLDHAFIVHDQDHEMLDALAGHDWRVVVVPYVPTAERIAQWCAEAIGPLLEVPLRLIRVTVRETPNSIAVFEP